MRALEYMVLTLRIGGVAGVRADCSGRPRSACRARDGDAGSPRRPRRRRRAREIPTCRRPATRRATTRTRSRSSSSNRRRARASGSTSRRSNGTPIKSFVVYPERQDKAPVVIVIQEIFGLTDWIRGVADQLAKEGFIAIAPDFMSGMGPNRRRQRRARRAGFDAGDRQADRRRQGADPERRPRLRRSRFRLRAASSATVGFCWGGGTSFLYAIKQPALNAAVSYYGPMPSDRGGVCQGQGAGARPLWRQRQSRQREHRDDEERHDARPRPSYEPHIFEGAGHGFLRQQNGSAQRSGQHEGGRGGLAAHDRVPEAAHQVRRGTRGVRLMHVGRVS